MIAILFICIPNPLCVGNFNHIQHFLFISAVAASGKHELQLIGNVVHEGSDMENALFVKKNNHTQSKGKSNPCRLTEQMGLKCENSSRQIHCLLWFALDQFFLLLFFFKKKTLRKLLKLKKILIFVTRFKTDVFSRNKCVWGLVSQSEMVDRLGQSCFLPFHRIEVQSSKQIG